MGKWFRSTPSRPILATALAVVLITSAGYFASRMSLPRGLHAAYHRGPDWAGTPLRETVDEDVSNAAINAADKVLEGQPFSARWTGYLIVSQSGLHRFTLSSDGGSRLYLDGDLVVDNGGLHRQRDASGERVLARGLHRILIDYSQAGGSHHLSVWWGYRDEWFRPLSSNRLSPRQLTAFGMWLRAWLHRLYGGMAFLWSVVLGGLLAGGIARAVRTAAPRRTEGRTMARPLTAVVLLALSLAFCGIWWGLHWAPDEIGPDQVLNAIEQGFSNGWYDIYPPLHYYVLAFVYLPFLVARSVFELDLLTPDIYLLLILVSRCVSVAMATGTVVTCYCCAQALRGPLAGLIAALSTAFVLPFVFYAKLANPDVPYLFYFALAILLYIRILQGGEAASYRGFALTATLAVCTKDQAYGFFVLPGLHVLAIRYQQLARTHARPLRALLTDRTLMSALLLAVASFAACHNLLFNWSGFVSHVRFITRPEAGAYRMFPGTVEGRIQLFISSVQLVRWSFGWPAFLVATLAVALSAVRRDRVLWLLLPAISYYVCFINVVLYTYDRFLLGVCVLLAIITGCRVADWAAGGGRRVKAGIVVGAMVLGYSAVRAASLDVMMIADSRYYVQRWFAANVPPDTPVAMVGLKEYLPTLEGFVCEYMDPAGDPSAAAEFPYVVINTDHIQRVVPGGAVDRFYQRLARGDGYSLALRYQTPLKWLPLAHDPVFTNGREDAFTNLDKVNPRIEVYRRE